MSGQAVRAFEREAPAKRGCSNLPARLLRPEELTGKRTFPAVACTGKIPGYVLQIGHYNQAIRWGNSMKFQWKILISPSVLVSATFIVFVCLASLNQHLWLYPTPNSVSVFLKSYSPQHVIESFESSQYGSELVGIRGASAGRRFITNQREFDPYFAIRSEKRIPLMNALSDDIYAHLVDNGALVISRNGDPQSGFQFEYRLGKSTGTITLSPLSPDSRILSLTPLPDGITDITLKIAVAEKWFPKETEAMQASVSLR
jgi:hypothetical protein